MSREPQDPPSKWPIVIDERIAPVFAFAFWGIICLLIVFATAEGKNSPITAFFASAGAAGQVFFAYVVWKLSKQQFDFVRKASDRQARIDSFNLRSAFFVDWRKALRTGLHNPSEAVFLKLQDLSVRAYLLFGDEVADDVHELALSYEQLLLEHESLDELRESDAS